MAAKSDKKNKTILMFYFRVNCHKRSLNPAHTIAITANTLLPQKMREGAPSGTKQNYPRCLQDDFQRGFMAHAAVIPLTINHLQLPIHSLSLPNSPSTPKS